MNRAFRAEGALMPNRAAGQGEEARQPEQMGGEPMTVIAATTLTLKPGAYPAFLEQHAKTKVMLERLGARNVQLMGSISGDPRRDCSEHGVR